jgi:N6-adenosine-specific RNA methylase IME4
MGKPIKIGEIKIDKRFRKAIGDLSPLIESMKTIGLLHPIVISKDKTLIAGQRRIEAAKKLGWISIPATIIDVKQVLRGELDENAARKDFTPSEQAAIAKAIWKEEEQKAKDRKKAGIRPSGNLPEGGRTRDLVARWVGVSGKTLVKELEILESRNKSIINLMDSASVDKAHKELRRLSRLQEMNKVGEFSSKNLYRVLYADPPWEYVGQEQHSSSGKTQHTVLENHYPTMSIQGLCDLPIAGISAKNSVLFLWVPSPHLENAFTVINSWGFSYKTSMVWDKVKHNVGNYVSVRHEFLLICGKGSSTPDIKKLHDSVYSEERTTHSKKPDYFRNLIDELYPNGKRIELFARGELPENWDSWGNEVKN